MNKIKSFLQAYILMLIIIVTKENKQCEVWFSHYLSYNIELMSAENMNCIMSRQMLTKFMSCFKNVCHLNEINFSDDSLLC